MKNMFKRIYSFPRGGIQVHDPSVPPKDSSVTAFLPSLSVIPLTQHSGAQALPLVSAGDIVREGMLIGRSKGAYSSNVHATVPGRVIRIATWKSSGNQIQEGILIRMKGSFEKLGKIEETFPWEGMLSYDIQRCISEYGVVEMEGTGRPVSDIISSFRNVPEPITLVVRCVFDDPWLAADYVLCKERTKDVVEGAAIAARTCRVSRIVYAVSHREKELGDMFIEAGYKWGIPVSVVLVSSRYPQRNRRELEMVLRNYQRKEGLDLGSLFILGPATLAAVYDAVKLRKPVLERYITVGGTAVKNPRVMKARIGTRIGELINECGGFKGTPKITATGSPFLGRPVMDLNEPVIKTTFAIFANMDGYGTGGPEINSSCIGCGECRYVCPVGLDPEELYKGIQTKEKNPGRELNKAKNCHGCGCCELVCPSALPLSTEIIASVKWRAYD